MPESGTVLHVLLFTDLVGSTDLKGRVGDAAAARAVSFHDKLFRECLAQFQGLERDDTGDGFFATFEVPSNAVRCALAFHQGLRAPGAPTPLQARVGIHMGEIVEVDSGLSGAGRVKLVGLAVDTAARVMGLAQGGQVLLTRHTFDSVRQQVRAAPDGSAIEWLDHGPYRLKGIEDAINVCEVGVSGLSSLTPPPDSEKAQRAVAPGDEVTLGKRPAVGQRISGRDKWKLERKIGEGGFGEVWVARHDDTREQRAFKFCFEAERLRTLKRELRLFRLIREQLGERQDIARLFEVQFDRAPYYLEMEYTAGGNLADWAAGEGGISQMPLDLRINLVLQLCGALSAAHSVGVIHRDVKPTNILIQENNDGRLDVRLTDFGIGQVMSAEQLAAAGITDDGFTHADSMTELDSRSGTRVYAAPELLAGKAPSAQSDVYALGVLLYQVVSGNLNRPIAHGWEKHVEDASLRKVIAGCVAGDLAERLSSVEDVSRRLRAMPGRRRLRRFLWLAACFGVVILATFIVFSARSAQFQCSRNGEPVSPEPSSEPTSSGTSKLQTNEIGAIETRDFESVLRHIRENASIAGLEFEPVASTGRVRVSGFVLNEHELDVLHARLAPVGDQIDLEVRVDAESARMRMQRELSAAGGKDVRVRLRRDTAGDRLTVHFTTTSELSSRRAREIAESFVFDKSLVDVRGLKE